MHVDLVPDFRFHAPGSARRQSRSEAPATAANPTDIPLWARNSPFLLAPILQPTQPPAVPASRESSPDPPYKPTAREDVATALLRAIALDFAKPKPIYLIDSGPSNPPGLQCRGSHGFTSGILDMVAKPFLENRSQWGGRGFATVVDRSEDSGYFSTVLHEAAHHCEMMWFEPAALLSEQDFEKGDWPQVLARKRRAADDVANAGGTSCDRWHGARFIRAHVHLLYRAACVGSAFTVDYDLKVAGPFYGLSDGSKYARALADEAISRKGEPIASILFSKTPDAFNELWLCDGGDLNQLVL